MPFLPGARRGARCDPPETHNRASEFSTYGVSVNSLRDPFGADADPRMGNRRGKSIGRIRPLPAATGKKRSHHHRNLRFFGVTGSDHGFLDEIGGIFRDGKACERRDDESYSPRLPEF